MQNEVIRRDFFAAAHRLRRPMIPTYASPSHRQLAEIRDDAQMFELAPVSLWVEDFSAIRRLFDRWRSEGVTSLREYLHEDPERVKACAELIQVVKVNRRTLELYEARDCEELLENLGSVFRSDMLETHVQELAQLWDGKNGFESQTVNYTLTGGRLDILLKGTVLPGYEENWERILVSVEDVTDRERGRRLLGASAAYARGLFEHSPVSLWVEDFSSVKRLLDEARGQGIRDLRVFTDVHPEFVQRCVSEIRVVDVNRHTLQLFGAPDKSTLLNRLGEIFRDDMHPHFREQLIDLWHGKLFQQREVVNYSLAGEELHVHLQFSVLPGYEHDWSLVQVALTDITARKRAEAYLEYLGRHDVLTKLHNRSFYAEELNRLERKSNGPVTVIIADLNGLKEANDELGHAAGDDLLRRAGEVFNELVRPPCHAARIGGDEFALILPGMDRAQADTVVEELEKLVAVNNQFYSSVELSMSVGTAISRPGERLEEAVKRADAAMYEAKRAHYERFGAERRRPRLSLVPAPTSST